jgi:hypothetical protein
MAGESAEDIEKTEDRGKNVGTSESLNVEEKEVKKPESRSAGDL